MLDFHRPTTAAHLVQSKILVSLSFFICFLIITIIMTCVAFFIVPPLEVAQPPIVSDGPLDSCHVLVSHIGSSSIWIQKNEVVYINLIEKFFAEHVPLEPLDSEPIIGAMYAVQLSDGRK